MFAVDLHSHTRFFHRAPALGRAFDPVGARLLAWAAKRRGLDGIVTTNHDFYRSFGLGDEEFAVLPGIEVSTTMGHVLVVGPTPPRRTVPGELTPEQVVDLAHDRDCAAVLAHPYRNSTVREADADFDAVEVNGKGTDPAAWVRQLARERDLPLVGGSDAHYPVEVGRAYTLVDADELSAESVVDAIRDGRVEARMDRSPVQQTVRRAYELIHDRKGWLDQSAPEPPGLGTPPGEEQARGSRPPGSEES
ncbi:MAG: CehA/McbA family metallohydrolase [Haloglomus sp.]